MHRRQNILIRKTDIIILKELHLILTSGKLLSQLVKTIWSRVFCSPFSLEAVDLLEKLKVKKYKIPSNELTNIPLLEKVVRTKKPILLSTGMIF